MRCFFAELSRKNFSVCVSSIRSSCIGRISVSAQLTTAGLLTVTSRRRNLPLGAGRKRGLDHKHPLLPLDFSPSCLAMGAYVKRAASLFGARASLIHVFDRASYSGFELYLRGRAR
jgi:hypothetical protein